MKPPAFPLYAQDALVGTALMSCEEFGAYMRLLLYQWAHGSLPDDPKALKMLAGAKVSAIVLEKFTKGEDGKLRNDRMEMERQKQSEFREKQRENGNRGGRPKLNQVEPKNNPSLNPNESPHRPTPQDEDEKGILSSSVPKGIAKGMQADGFPDAWSDFLAYRSEKGEPLTTYTIRATMIKLERVGPKKAVAMIRTCIEKGWKNLLEDHELMPKTGAGNSKQNEPEKPKKKTALEIEIDKAKHALANLQSLPIAEVDKTLAFLRTLADGAICAYFSPTEQATIQRILA